MWTLSQVVSIMGGSLSGTWDGSKIFFTWKFEVGMTGNWDWILSVGVESL